MALIRCPDCNREVSDAAPSCPGCGRPIAKAHAPATPVEVEQEALKLEAAGIGCQYWAIGIVVVLALIILLAGGG